jgi:uncharacterized membrane protein YdbT with pleckstrin-like domain
MAVRDVDPHHLKRYLLPHEIEDTVIIRRHPAVLLRHAVEVVGGLILAAVLSVFINPALIVTIIWCLWLLVIARFLVAVFEWTDEFFAVTKVRVMLVTGLFERRVDMMPLSKVTDLTVNRSIMGRMLGYGTVVLESAGQDQALSTVKYVPEPESIYLHISAAAFGSGDD